MSGEGARSGLETSPSRGVLVPALPRERVLRVSLGRARVLVLWRTCFPNLEGTAYLKPKEVVRM